MSIKNVLNDFPYRPRYYLTHPWKFFQECWYNLQAAYSRATKGYAWQDSAEMDNFLLTIIPGMLRDIANGHAYPGTKEFPTYESWKKWCNDLADTFESLQLGKWEDGKNEYEEEWYTLCNLHRNKHPNLTMACPYDTSDEHFKDLTRKYFNRCTELMEERKQKILEAYTILAQHADALWI